VFKEPSGAEVIARSKEVNVKIAKLESDYAEKMKQLAEKLSTGDVKAYTKDHAAYLEASKALTIEFNSRLFKCYYEFNRFKSNVNTGFLNFLNRWLRPRKYRVDQWNDVMAEADALERIKNPTPEEHRRRFACYAKLDEMKKKTA
jgi:hypothetical protein